MTEEQLADYKNRLVQAREKLYPLRELATTLEAYHRLSGTIEGIGLAEDYLRGYK